jgi:hypothetical protein
MKALTCWISVRYFASLSLSAMMSTVRKTLVQNTNRGSIQQLLTTVTVYKRAIEGVDACNERGQFPWLARGLRLH